MAMMATTTSNSTKVKPPPRAGWLRFRPGAGVSLGEGSFMLLDPISSRLKIWLRFHSVRKILSERPVFVQTVLRVAEGAGASWHCHLWMEGTPHPLLRQGYGGQVGPLPTSWGEGMLSSRRLDATPPSPASLAGGNSTARRSHAVFPGRGN